MSGLHPNLHPAPLDPDWHFGNQAGETWLIVPVPWETLCLEREWLRFFWTYWTCNCRNAQCLGSEEFNNRGIRFYSSRIRLVIKPQRLRPALLLWNKSGRSPLILRPYKHPSCHPLSSVVHSVYYGEITKFHAAAEYGHNTFVRFSFLPVCFSSR